MSGARSPPTCRRRLNPVLCAIHQARLAADGTSAGAPLPRDRQPNNFRAGMIEFVSIYPIPFVSALQPLNGGVRLEIVWPLGTSVIATR